jgi:hypothetical protein
MQRFSILTLLDITETKQYRKELGREVEWQQQQNFQMLLQVIGLRVNPLYRTGPTVDEANLKDYQFGHAYKNNHRVWTFNFEIEYDGGFTDALGREEGLLVEDLHFVPMIVGLTETVELAIPMFDTQAGQYRNTIVYLD